MSRLDSIAPQLSKALSNLEADRLKSVKLAACKYAIESLNHQPGDLVAYATNELAESGKLSKDIRDRLASIAYTLDERYYALSEDEPDDEEAYMPFLSQARALNAIAYAGEDDPFESASEAIYEASQAVKDSGAFFAYINSLI